MKPIDITCETMTEADFPALTEVMTRAFDDDTRRHTNQESGGPEGYDDGGFFRKWLLPYNESHGFKVLLDDRIVGGVIVWILPNGKNIVGTIFVDPKVQGFGIGTQVWRFIEAEFPDTVSWTLGTPEFSTSSHAFYEKKCGFVKIEEEEAPDHEGMSFIYCKEMQDASG